MKRYRGQHCVDRVKGPINMQEGNRRNGRKEGREAMGPFNWPARNGDFIRGVRRPLSPIIYQIGDEVWDEECPAGPDVGGELTVEKRSGSVSGHERRYAKVDESY